ncbi:MAG: DUF4071 domain-containing protein [Bacteroidetes bacterium]|nr:DUF4071 domain-containing protein [Bacteroidota bacterium]
MKTCFVIIGYGIKPDLATGRKLNLDATFENLIKPVFKSLRIECFRAIDKNKTGVIDLIMYEWILKADIVLADISTLNANVIYELGVRHALRPYSTIIISEKKLMQDLPFDIDHTIIHQYEHLESDIGHTEVLRFRKLLKNVLLPIIDKPTTDSPVYTFLRNLDAPKFKRALKEKVRKGIAIPPSISDLVLPAEDALNKNNFTEAKKFFNAALFYDKTNTYLNQRLALATYKERPNNKAALNSAQKILSKLNPNETTDPETLGLSGAINKRLFEITNNENYLDKALWFYERGFYIQQDYYTGINLAYQLNVKANTITSKNEAISFYLQANRIRGKVIEICTHLIKSKSFKDRGDKEWIYQSLAQAMVGLNRKKELKSVIHKINELSKGKFDLTTFNEQNKKLFALMASFEKRHGKIR